MLSTRIFAPLDSLFERTLGMIVYGQCSRLTGLGSRGDGEEQVLCDCLDRGQKGVFVRGSVEYYCFPQIGHGPIHCILLASGRNKTGQLQLTCRGFVIRREQTVDGRNALVSKRFLEWKAVQSTRAPSTERTSCEEGCTGRLGIIGGRGRSTCVGNVNKAS